jgi:glutaredoxin
MILVELYSKDDCHLCEDAKAVLQSVQKQIPFSLKEIVLLPGEAYYNEYTELVPVVHINGVFTFKYRVNEHALTAKLREMLDNDRKLPPEVPAA